MNKRVSVHIVTLRRAGSEWSVSADVPPAPKGLPSPSAVLLVGRPVAVYVRCKENKKLTSFANSQMYCWGRCGDKLLDCVFWQLQDRQDLDSAQVRHQTPAFGPPAVTLIYLIFPQRALRLNFSPGFVFKQCINIYTGCPKKIITL